MTNTNNTAETTTTTTAAAETAKRLSASVSRLARSFLPEGSIRCRLVEDLRGLPEANRRDSLRQNLELLAETVNRAGGVPATYHIGSDHYAVKAVRMSASGKSVVVEIRGQEKTFRFNKLGRFAGKGGVGVVTLGEARTELDPSF